MTDSGHIDPVSLLRETRWLHTLADGLVHDEHAAEDIVQSTFLQALTHPPLSAGALRTWLARVARRFSYRSGAHARWVRRWEHDAARPEAQPSAADLVTRASLHRQLVEAVLALDEPNRSTILLRYFDDLPPREVAKRHGVPVATVRSRTRRALEQLRARLDCTAGGREAWLSVLVVPGMRLSAASATVAAAGSAAKAKLTITASVVLLIAGAFGWKALWAPAPEQGGDARSGAPLPGSTMVAAEPAPARTVPSLRPKSIPIRPRHLDELAGGSREHRLLGTVLDEDTGSPIAGAEISITRAEPGSEPLRTMTNEDGRFALVVGQHYWDSWRDPLTIKAVDHVPFAWNAGPRPESRISGPDTDLRELRLERGAIVSGRIMTMDGHPVAGASLFLKGAGAMASPMDGVVPVGASSESGTFTLPDRIGSTTSPQRLRELFLVAVHPAGVDWAFLSIAKRVDRIAVEILAREGRNTSVRVVDADEHPQSDAVVLALPRFLPVGVAGQLYQFPSKPAELTPGSPTEVLERRFVGKTNASGCATFTALPESKVDGPWDRLAENAIEFFAFKDSFEPASAKVAAPFAGPVTIVVTPKREHAITGSVRDIKGTPIGGASVGLDNRRSLGSSVMTNDAGEFRISRSGTGDAGQWSEVTATAPGLAFAAKRIWIAPGQPDPKIDFTLEPAAPVKGRVVDEAGKPLAGVRAELRRNSSTAWFVPGDHDGITEEDGKFSFPLADAGSWELTTYFLADANKSSGQQFETPRRRAVSGGQWVEIVFRRSAIGKTRLNVEVVDAETGMPVDAAVAALLPANGIEGDSYSFSQLECSRGRATGEHVLPGLWHLIVQAIGFARHEQILTIRPEDEELKIRAALSRTGVVVAEVVLDDIPAEARPPSLVIWAPDCRWVTEPGKPAPNATRGCGTAADSNHWTCRFEDVTPGTPLRFWISGDGLAAEELITIRSGETRAIEIHPKSAGKVRFATTGRVTGGLRLEVGDGLGNWYWLAATSLDSPAVWSHEIDRAPGSFRWRLQVLALDVAPRVRQAKIYEGEAKVEPGRMTAVEINIPE